MGSYVPVKHKFGNPNVITQTLLNTLRLEKIDARVETISTNSFSPKNNFYYFIKILLSLILTVQLKLSIVLGNDLAPNKRHSLLWRHNGHSSVLNHQPYDCLHNRYSDADQSKHQSCASLAFVWGINRGPVNSPHKWPVTRKMFPFDDVIMLHFRNIYAHRILWRHMTS